MKHLIITETHRAITEEMRGILQSRHLSFTFLPLFYPNLDEDYIDENSFFVSVSNYTTGLTLSGESKFHLSKLFEGLHNKNIISLISDIVTPDGTIFLAQDNDTMGNFMATALYYQLLSKGFKEENIKRVVGIQRTNRDGEEMLDIYMGNFIPKELFIAILKRKHREKLFTYENKKIDTRLHKGYRNIVALSKALEATYEEMEVQRQSEGVSLATYITKTLLGEEGGGC